MAIAGKSGKLGLGANTVVDVSSWSLELGADTLDVTALGDDWKKFIAGLKEWSASAEGFYSVHTDATGQKALQDAYLNSTEVALKLFVNATNYYSGSAYISGMSVEDPVDDTVSISFEFQGTGALSYN
ncbi:phage tail tube protein [Dehalococcoides sp. THU3]|uniref:phage tail tube protein n=1 Tax=Dehalococcoides TaxID=61434 RepID=UPI0032188080